jgi:hypothetical protein
LGTCDKDPSAVEGFDVFMLDETRIVMVDWECTNGALIGKLVVFAVPGSMA